MRTACAAAAVAVILACFACSASPRKAPAFPLAQLNNNFSAMASPTITQVTTDGQGLVAVLLPATSSDRHFADDAKPDIAEAFRKAGLTSSQYKVELSAGSGQYGQAKYEIDKDHASVLILDARYSQEGAAIEAYAKSKHVTVIDYDWLSNGGTASYYVGFDSLKIGVLQGEGLVNCASAWKIRQPQVLVMQGDPATDPNVPQYVQGARAVLDRQSKAGWQEVLDNQGTWDTSAALTDFQHQYAADRKISAVLFANDENGEPIIKYLQTRGVKPKTLATVGLDASTPALQNILADYQCGTVYKPIWLETEAAAALALYARDGLRFPALLNQSVTDSQTDRRVQALLLTPEWVDIQNMRSTVVADNFVTSDQLCGAASSDSAGCAAAGLTG